MSRTDRTMPLRLRQEDGIAPRRFSRAYPQPARRRELRHEYWRRERHLARGAMRRQDEPVPARPRHTVLRDLY